MWCVIDALQQDAAALTTVLLQNARGQPPAKRVQRSSVRLQQQLQSICSFSFLHWVGGKCPMLRGEMSWGEVSGGGDVRGEDVQGEMSYTHLL